LQDSNGIELVSKLVCKTIKPSKSVLGRIQFKPNLNLHHLFSLTCFSPRAEIEKPSKSVLGRIQFKPNLNLHHLFSLTCFSPRAKIDQPNSSPCPNSPLLNWSLVVQKPIKPACVFPSVSLAQVPHMSSLSSVLSQLLPPLTGSSSSY
jgi:hypothetical protein